MPGSDGATRGLPTYRRSTTAAPFMGTIWHPNRVQPQNHEQRSPSQYVLTRMLDEAANRWPLVCRCRACLTPYLTVLLYKEASSGEGTALAPRCLIVFEITGSHVTFAKDVLAIDGLSVVSDRTVGIIVYPTKGLIPRAIEALAAPELGAVLEALFDPRCSHCLARVTHPSQLSSGYDHQSA